MDVCPHLCFDGNCREAFEFYERTLGGQIEMQMTYGNSPLASETDPSWHDRLIHATLKLDNFRLLGADMMPGTHSRPQGFFVTLTLDEPSEAKRIFETLAEKGEVKMPFAPVFWSAGFGVVVDQFDIPWEINCSRPPKSAGTSPGASD